MLAVGAELAVVEAVLAVGAELAVVEPVLAVGAELVVVELVLAVGVELVVVLELFVHRHPDVLQEGIKHINNKIKIHNVCTKRR